jgi:hypothetical protein
LQILRMLFLRNAWPTATQGVFNSDL